jgi:hypothetical protein
MNLTGVGEGNTVSNGLDENGTLNSMAADCWQPLRHGSTQEAINNLLSRLAGGAAANLNIVGHGYAGSFETGDGQLLPYTGTREVSAYNAFDWAPLFGQLEGKPFGMLTIYGCNVGEGMEGVNLLQKIAKTIGKAVRAPNGTVSPGPDGIYLEADSEWVMATPTSLPTAKVAPALHEKLVVDVESHSHWPIDGEKAYRVTVTRYRLRSGKSEDFTFLGEDARGILSLSFGSLGFTPPGPPLGRITARITLMPDSSDNAIAREFTVFSDQIVRDDKPAVYYYTSPAFRQLLNSL